MYKSILRNLLTSFALFLVLSDSSTPALSLDRTLVERGYHDKVSLFYIAGASSEHKEHNGYSSQEQMQQSQEYLPPPEFFPPSEQELKTQTNRVVSNEQNIPRFRKPYLNFGEPYFLNNGNTVCRNQGGGTQIFCLDRQDAERIWRINGQ